MSDRRNVLKLLLGGGAAALTAGAQSPLQLKFGPKSARAGIPGRTLIKVFMRGGADGMNLFPPYGDGEYYNVRPNIAVAPPGGGADRAINLNGFFGMHPQLQPLMEIWNNGDMALMPAAHMEGTGRSHFDNQRWIEQGRVGVSNTGYLGRYVDLNAPVGDIQAIVAGRTSTTTSLRASRPITAVRRGSDFEIEDSLWCEGNNCSTNNYYSLLERLWGETPENASPVEAAAYENGLNTALRLGIFQSLDDNYQPTAGGLDYSNSSFGDALRLTAQLLKADVGLEVVAMDWNISWDTHSNQLPNGVSHDNSGFGYHERMNRGANDMLTFYRDISGLRDDVAMVLGTEFGRTVRENGSRGTDHGRAAAWFAIGGRVNGGVQGAWPGLAEQNLHERRFLDFSLEYRDIMSEAMTVFLGAPASQLPTVFPGRNFTAPGIFNGTGT